MSTDIESQIEAAEAALVGRSSSTEGDNGGGVSIAASVGASGETLDRLIDDGLLQRVDVDGVVATRQEHIATRLLDECVRGRRWAIDLVTRRIWPAVQHVDMSGVVAPRAIDLTLLSDADLLMLEELAGKVGSGGSGGDSG